MKPLPAWPKPGTIASVRSHVCICAKDQPANPKCPVHKVTVPASSKPTTYCEYDDNGKCVHIEEVDAVSSKPEIPPIPEDLRELYESLRVNTHIDYFNHTDAQIKPLIERIAKLQEELKEHTENADYLRSMVGACHLMISRNDVEELTREDWDSTALPPRLYKFVAQLRAEVADYRKALSAEQDEYVAWLRWTGDHEHRRLALCDSDAEGAFKVYRYRAGESRKEESELRAEVERLKQENLDTVNIYRKTLDEVRAEYSRLKQKDAQKESCISKICEALGGDKEITPWDRINELWKALERAEEYSIFRPVEIGDKIRELLASRSQGTKEPK